MRLLAHTKAVFVALAIVLALIIKPFFYCDYKGHTVYVPMNTAVYVDVAAGIALIGDVHMDIAPDEYRIITGSA